MGEPADLVLTKVAAERFGLTASRIRRWANQDKITRYEGAPPASGGAPPGMVSLSELHRYLIEAGITPAPTPPVTTVQAPVSTTVQAPDAPAGVAAQVEIERLRLQLEIERHKGTIAALTAERDALRRTVQRIAVHQQESRSDLLQAREELDAVRAELQAERAARRLPFWRRLLPGPVDEA